MNTMKRWTAFAASALLLITAVVHAVCPLMILLFGSSRRAAEFHERPVREHLVHGRPIDR